jgi:hypothetical protein
VDAHKLPRKPSHEVDTIGKSFCDSFPSDHVVSIIVIVEKYEDYPPFLSLYVLEPDHALIEVGSLLFVAEYEG